MSTVNDVLQRLYETLAEYPELAEVTIVRNSAVPEEIPADGLIIVRDGDPIERQEVLGGFRDVYYQQEAAIEIFAAHGEAETRDERFSAMLDKVGVALEADLTLGGSIFGMSFGHPSVQTEPVEGGHDIKYGSVSVVLDFFASTPLG